MHPYATDSNERIVVPIVLAGAAVLATIALERAVKCSGLQDALWWVDLPAVWGFYVLFWKAFDRWAWDWTVVRAIGMVTVPNFTGEWVGHGESSYKDRAGQRTHYDVKITIQQCWRTCLVRGETGSSRSKSTIGAVLVKDGGPPTLSYEYRNEPSAHAGPTMHAHPGMARLEMVDTDHLEGEYYTGRDRQNYGTLTLTRQ